MTNQPQISEEERLKRATANAVEAAEAQRLAAITRAQQIESGDMRPTEQVLAESVKNKLLNSEFSKN